MKTRGPSENEELLSAWQPALQTRVRPPVAIALGSPRQVTQLVQALRIPDCVAYQMDLWQAERLEAELADHGVKATITASADLWDLPGEFQTVLYPVEPRGERMLKLDMIEQAFHILKPHGTLMVLSRQEKDQFFPAALKKIYGRVHAPQVGDATLLWCQRESQRQHERRRHELTFHVSAADGEGPSLRFLSRPGVFSYGRFDNGARALMETAEIHPGEQILDLGCGCGTNGVIAGKRAGDAGHVVFVDSSLRATVVAGLNAEANGLSAFKVRACCLLDDLPPRSFDVVLTNPPYFANLGIAKRFVEQARPLLEPRGRFYLVTKQPETVGPMVAEHFGPTQATEQRGYVVLTATART
jgi:16S rRNA (guanine1207-N2)-methyltransferase